MGATTIGPRPLEATTSRRTSPRAAEPVESSEPVDTSEVEATEPVASTEPVDTVEISEEPADIPPVTSSNQALGVAWTYWGELDTAAQGGEPDGMVSEADLRAALNDPDTPPELRAAIEYLLTPVSAGGQEHTRYAHLADNLMGYYDEAIPEEQIIGLLNAGNPDAVQLLTDHDRLQMSTDDQGNIYWLDTGEPLTLRELRALDQASTAEWPLGTLVQGPLEDLESQFAPQGGVPGWLHASLDVVGMVPVIGELADGTNALLYMSEGDMLNAGISLAGLVPFVGMAGTGARLVTRVGREALEEAEELGLQTVAREGTQAAARQLDEFSTYYTPPHETGSLTGPRTEIPQATTKTRDRTALLENQRSLTRENEAAQTMADHGYHVEQNPMGQGVKNPDYLIDGKYFDCYSPNANKDDWGVVQELTKKASSGQATGFVVNLADNQKVTVDGLLASLNSGPPVSAKIEEVIVILPDGQVVHIAKTDSGEFAVVP